MKLKPEDYAHLKKTITSFLITHNLSDHRSRINYHQACPDTHVIDVEKRLRWDLCYMAHLTEYICMKIYPYANDDHIDTALRKIMKEWEASHEGN